MHTSAKSKVVAAQPERNNLLTIKAVLADILDVQDVDEEILQIFAAAGLRSDRPFATVKERLGNCHDKVVERFYSMLDGKMPLIPFGILMKRLE